MLSAAFVVPGSSAVWSHCTGRTTQLSPQGSWYIVSRRALCSYAPQRASDTISTADTERSRVPASFQKRSAALERLVQWLACPTCHPQDFARALHQLDIAVMHIRGCPGAQRHVRATYGCPRTACHLNTRIKRWTKIARWARPVPSTHRSKCYKPSTGRLLGS